MSKGKTYTYSPDHMAEIAKQFEECAKTLEEAIERNNAAKSVFEGNYEGQAAEITTDAFGKIEEHMQLLAQCCRTTENYVSDCMASMQDADTEIASSYKK